MIRQRLPFARVGAAATVFATALLLASCAMPGGSGSASPDEDSPATSTDTVLTEENLLGTWGSTGEQEPYLTFEEDGTVAGSDGCNRLVGAWSLADETVTLENLAGTLMACEGVDTWLVDAASAVLAEGEDDELSVRDGGGAEIGTLERDD
ncbi:MAG: META domain-containing protein [Mycetocola sp.]